MISRLIPVVFGTLFLCSTVISATNSEAGSYFIRVYSPKVYSADPQNWALLQDHTGVMFFGNSDGVLTFDGQRWSKIRLPNSSIVRSLAVDQAGTVYVGGQAELGFLAADPHGSLNYVSLLPKIDPRDRAFNDVWTAFNTRSGIVFSSYRRLFRWSPQRGMEVWRPSSRFSQAFLVGDTPYLIENGAGLYRLINSALQPVPGGQIFSNSAALRGVFRFSGSLYVATPDALYSEHNGKFEKCLITAKALLHEGRIYTCLPLDDRTLAIGTVRHGLVLMSSEGTILRVIDRDSGLPGNYVNSLFRDREGGLWLALNSGLARVDPSLPVTRFSEREGLYEPVLSIARQDGVLFVGTMAGLFRLVSRDSGSPRFVPVAGVHGQVTLLPSPHGLLVGAPAGVYQLTDNGPRIVAEVGAINNLASSPLDSSTVFAAGRHGLFVLRWNGREWTQSNRVDALEHDFDSVSQDLNGSVWVTTLSDVWRIDLKANPVRIEYFSQESGVPVGRKTVCQFRQAVLLATEHALLRFDVHTRKSVVDPAFGAAFADEARTVSNIFKAPNDEFWISGEGYHAVLQPGESGHFTWHENVLANWGIQQLSALSVDPDGVIWAAATDGGLIRYDPHDAAFQHAEFRALVRRVQVMHRDRTVFAGAGTTANTSWLRHRDNNLHFDFSAPLFAGASETEFRVRLEGLDRSWSAWTTQADKEYTNLWEGTYVFRVQARDLQGRLSREATFRFRVLPPLYRTAPAFLLYAICTTALIWLIVKWRLATVAAQNHKLETIIEQRTDEIRRQRDEIKAHEETTERLLLNILPGPIADELRTTGSVAPLCCDGITVCFTDFVGFTLSSEKLGASGLVAALDKYFTEFDRIIDRYGLEKLKTIGDSYMFVSGLPQEKSSHAVDAIMAALEIVETVERLADSPPGWQIRIGLDSGPVVAGVVGLRKFAFDIWGETVNFASRHESSGKPNRVNISARTYELVRDFFDCEPRGPIRIKDGRYFEMYIVQGIRRDLLHSGGTSFADLYVRRFGVAPPRAPQQTTAAQDGIPTALS